MPSNITSKLEIVPVEHMDEVLAQALAVDDPARFLREGDHAIEDIYDPLPEADLEAEIQAGVN